MDFADLVEERDWANRKWHWPKTDHGLWNIRDELYKEQVPNIMKHVKASRVCVQAGGALGMAPWIYSGIFESVYTFEPNALNFYFLNLNVRSKNVIKLNAVLGYNHKLAGITDNDDESNRGIFTVKDEGIIPTLMVDDLNLSVCDLIHLDIEGYEINALRGARHTIHQFHPVIVGEGIKGRGDCVAFLEDEYGYTYVENVVSDAIFVKLK